MTPEGWERALFADCFDFQGGGQPPASKFVREPHPGYVRLLQIRDFESDEYAVYIPSQLARSACQATDILVARYGASLGRILTGKSGAYNVALVKMLFDEQFVNRRFAFFWLCGRKFQNRLVQIGARSAQAGFNKADLSSLEVLLPPLSEQRKIAAILSSVDDAIEASQAVIDQLQVVKKAMMAELLTKGLPGRHNKFKRTEIGEVPAEWEAVLLDSVAKRGSGHTPDKKHPEYWDGDIKWVSLKDSWQLDRLYIDDTEAKITPQGIANSSAVEHPAGTVVLSRDAGVGKSAITTDVMAVSQHFMAWVCGPQLDNHFLYYWLQQRKPEFERIAIGNTIKTIGLPYFKALYLPVPPMAEQKAIAQTLISADNRLFAEETAQESLRATKSALMSVLLTGEVRVRVDDEAAA